MPRSAAGSRRRKSRGTLRPTCWAGCAPGTSPCAPVLSRTDVLEHEQVVENRIIERHEDPVLGVVRQPRPAARFAGTPSGIRRLAPFLGADNAAILAELGYDPDSVRKLAADDVLASMPPEAEDAAP